MPNERIAGRIEARRVLPEDLPIPGPALARRPTSHRLPNPREARRELLLVEEVIEVRRNMEPLVAGKGKTREAAHLSCGQTARGQYGTNGIGKGQRIPVFAHAPASTTSGPELGRNLAS